MKSILYLEDDHVAIDLLKMLLSGKYELETTSRADEALSMICNKQYDLLLVDINLGYGMNGMDVARIIKEKPEYSETPVVAITAYASENEKNLFLSKGFTHYISKPFYSKDLNALLEKALTQKQI